MLDSSDALVNLIVCQLVRGRIAARIHLVRLLELMIFVIGLLKIQDGTETFSHVQPAKSMHIYTIIHGCEANESPIPLLATCRCSHIAVCYPSFLAISHGLPHGIGCARYLGHLPPGHGFCGDYDVFELVLGNDIDGVGVYRS